MLNPCCNDSENPGYCAAWQGIGRVESFQSAVGIFFGWVALRAEGGDEGGMDSRTASGRFGGICQSSAVSQPKAEPKKGHNMTISRTDPFSAAMRVMQKTPYLVIMIFLALGFPARILALLELLRPCSSKPASRRLPASNIHVSN